MSELKNVSIFENLSYEELGELEKLVVRQRYRADAAVFFEGDSSDTLYIIRSGKVKVSRRSDDGREQILDTLFEGAIFGEMAMLDGQPRSATVTTLEPTVLLSISRCDFRRFAARCPDVLWKVLESLCKHLRRSGSDILDLSFRDVPYRLLRKIDVLADAHGEESPRGVTIKMRVTPDVLAGMVGSSRERVSRLLDGFEDRGLVRRQGDRLIVRDKKALKHALRESQEWSS